MMPSELTWNQLHDATLVRIEFHWERGDVVVHVRTGQPSISNVHIVAQSGRHVDCPRLHPWGPSVSINEVRGPTPILDGKAHRLELEMQSGDVIAIEAAEFRLGSGDQVVFNQE